MTVVEYRPSMSTEMTVTVEFQARTTTLPAIGRGKPGAGPPTRRSRPEIVPRTELRPAVLAERCVVAGDEDGLAW